MARTESRTKTAIWSDDDFRKRTGRAQRMYWLLYSQPTISLCGVLALTERRWAATASDETTDTVRAALDELEEHSYILVDWDTEEVFVRSFVRHDGVGRTEKTSNPAWRQLNSISSPALRQAAERELGTVSNPPDDYRNTQPDTVPDTPSDTQPDRVFPEPEIGYTACGKQDGNTQPDTPRAGARAVSVSVSSLLIPVSHQPDPGGKPPPDGETGAQRHGETKPNHLAIAHRIAEVCAGTNRAIVNTEAAEVAVWAAPHVATAIIEEAIGWCQAQDKPPDLPRAVAKVITIKAADKRIRLRRFQPQAVKRVTA